MVEDEVPQHVRREPGLPPHTPEDASGVQHFEGCQKLVRVRFSDQFSQVLALLLPAVGKRHKQGQGGQQLPWQVALHSTEGPVGLLLQSLHKVSLDVARRGKGERWAPLLDSLHRRAEQE